MKRDFLIKKITYLQNGVDNHTFNSLMFKNINKWNTIRMNDVDLLIHIIKYDGTALYAFLPFFIVM